MSRKHVSKLDRLQPRFRLEARLVTALLDEPHGNAYRGVRTSDSSSLTNAKWAPTYPRLLEVGLASIGACGTSRKQCGNEYWRRLECVRPPTVCMKLLEAPSTPNASVSSFDPSSLLLCPTITKNMHGDVSTDAYEPTTHGSLQFQSELACSTQCCSFFFFLGKEKCKKSIQQLSA